MGVDRCPMPPGGNAARWGIHPMQSWLEGVQPGDGAVDDPISGGCQVFSHPDCLRVLTDVDAFSSDFSAFAPHPGARQDPLDRFITQMDPPLHTEARGLLGGELRSAVVRSLEPRIRELTDEYLARMSGHDEVDVVDGLTYPIPVRIITELIGLPAADWPLYRRWVEGITRHFEAVSAGGDGRPDRRSLALGLRCLTEFVDHLEQHVIGVPVSAASLVGRLRGARLKGAAMTPRQIARFLLILLVAGHITTTMLIGNALLCLDVDRETRAAVRRDPDLLDGVLDEAARLLSPFAALPRVARLDVAFGDRLVPTGTPVLAWIGAANRDGRQFSEQHCFRPTARRRGSLSFGAGPHSCPGAALARTEGRIILERLLQTYPDLAVRADSVEFHPSANTCGVRRLTISPGTRPGSGTW